MKETVFHDSHYAFVIGSAITDHFTTVFCPNIRTVKTKECKRYKSFIDYKNPRDELNKINCDWISETQNVNNLDSIK